MKKILLNLYLWPAFAILTIIGLILLPVILLVNMLMGRTLGSALRLAIRFYGWVLVCKIPFMAPPRIFGQLEDIPGPSIFVANHCSAIDPYLFGAIPGESCFVTSWPFKIPIYSPLMKLAGYINIADGWENIRKQCAKMLDEKVSIIIWPEGHRSRDGTMGRFRKGAFQLAVETGYPIQPVCIIGSGDILQPGEKLFSPGRVKLVILEPIYPSGEGDAQLRIFELRRRSFAAIESCLFEHSSGNLDALPAKSATSQAIS